MVSHFLAHIKIGEQKNWFLLENELDSTKWKRQQTKTTNMVGHVELPAFRQTFANMFLKVEEGEKSELKKVQERGWCQSQPVIDSGYFVGGNVTWHIFQGSFNTINIYDIFKKQLLVALLLNICFGKWSLIGTWPACIHLCLSVAVFQHSHGADGRAGSGDSKGAHRKYVLSGSLPSVLTSDIVMFSCLDSILTSPFASSVALRKLLGLWKRGF